MVNLVLHVLIVNFLHCDRQVTKKVIFCITETTQMAYRFETCQLKRCEEADKEASGGSHAPEKV